MYYRGPSCHTYFVLRGSLLPSVFVLVKIVKDIGSGNDTTGGTLSFAIAHSFYHLFKNPVLSHFYFPLSVG
jgi:hypothetical protein